MKREPTGPQETPSQTAGPFVHIGLASRVAGLGGMTKISAATLSGPTPKASA